MSKRKTREQFISDAIAIHGDKYDYSKVEYVAMKVKVQIICPIHNIFEQTPDNHIRGHGCPKCKAEKNKTLIYGVGINDLVYSKYSPVYKVWFAMLRRCYDTQGHKKHTKTYENCSVCSNWLKLSSFSNWFYSSNSGYKHGYHLDKDILVKGNKIYSPETCCFVPGEINSLLTNRKNFRGEYPIGVQQAKNGKFIARSCGEKRHIGVYNTIKEAFNAYKIAKEQHIKELADKYFKEGKITQRVYNALMKYEVEITD